ncbi:type II toxin-antitoxin system PemK/MazF family toxin [Faecalibacterium prausnitzii]|uniref:type II toxin-antitoxin system PemK/MazF family toxin n=1 Tax=Faecalibacterium prausnitzii TaxID=853 RepID=UPI0022DEE622|nr:type II toxin-antitoxin system PemK/MazF family toxin [Faecalibacterium prausnitzii]
MRDLNLLNQAWPNAVFGLRPRLFFLLIPCDEPLNKHTAHCQGGAAGGVHIEKGGQLLIQNWKFQRGDIFFTRFDNAIGSEQSGNRPAVVLQNDVGNFYSPTLIVATLTSKAAKKYTQPTHCLLVNEFLSVPSIVQAEQIFTVDKSRVLKFLGHLTPEEMSRVDDAVRASLALNPMGSIQRLPPIIRSTAAYAPPEVVDGKPPLYPYTPIKSSFEDAGSVEDMMLYAELEAAVHAMIQRLEYSFTFNPSLLTIPKRKQQVADILKEAETYIWRIKEEMRCSTSTAEKTHRR